MSSPFWLAVAAYLVPTFPLGYRMTSIRGFLTLETAFTAVQFLIVGPLIALAWQAGR